MVQGMVGLTSRRTEPRLRMLVMARMTQRGFHGIKGLISDGRGCEVLVDKRPGSFLIGNSFL